MFEITISFVEQNSSMFDMYLTLYLEFKGRGIQRRLQKLCISYDTK